MNLINRPRRLRNGALLRSMVRETRISADTLIYPMFVQDGENIREEIPSMPGQYRWSLDRVDELLQQVTDSGVKSVLLFGIPAEKDEIGSSAWQPDGIVQRAVHHIKAAYPQLYVITDVCMCEYTSHGHCGILCGHDVDNDKTLEVLAKTALSHVQAGADMVAPSDMMDGRVARIRQVLDENGYVNTPIMSYSVKYASAFYGPVPGCSRFCAGVRRPEKLSDGSPQCTGGAAGGRTGRAGGRRYFDGKAGHGVSGCVAVAEGKVSPACGAVQRQRRVCHDPGGSGCRLYRPGGCDL